MTLFVLLLLIANGLIAYYCYANAAQKGYPKGIFLGLGLVPYFNLVVLVYLLFLPNLKHQNLLDEKAAS